MLLGLYVDLWQVSGERQLFVAHRGKETIFGFAAHSPVFPPGFRCRVRIFLMLLTRVSSMFGPRIYEILRRMSAQIELTLEQALCVSYERSLNLWYISVGVRIIGVVTIEDLKFLKIRVVAKVDKTRICCRSNHPIRFPIATSNIFDMSAIDHKSNLNWSCQNVQTRGTKFCNDCTESCRNRCTNGSVESIWN